jgi:serine/threonine protein kinase
MTPERWQQVKSTLADALECQDPREQLAFLRRTCANDADLAREVQSLLDQPPDQFDACAENVGLTSAASASADDIGCRIGPYELQREIGRGGMGSVWLARRADRQFEKLVAIKLLKRGTDTDEVLRRFRAEREILARLEHPNIARLIDCGTTTTSLPYFVMEHVVGER